MRLFKTLLSRVLFGILALLFVSFVTFLADEMAPGDAATLIAGEKATAGTLARVRHEMGLDRPWPVRYVDFVVRAAQFDFGRSYTGTKEPVADVIRRNLPMTARIAVQAMLLAAFVGIALGTVAGVWNDRWPDRIALALSTLGVTIPNFVLAPVLVYLFALQLDILPVNWEVQRLAPDYYYLLLPVIILSLRPMATLTRLTRASVIDTMGQEYIRLAIAKGVPRPRLILVHALRNALVPVVTAFGTSFGFLLTGSFIVETAFTLPGLGRAGIEAIQKRDTPVIMATTLVAGTLFILVNLLVDLAMPLLDPRIRETPA